MSLRFSAVADGVSAEISGRELAVLEAVPGFLSSVASDDSSGSIRQARPAVYADEEADREFHRLVASDLDEVRTQDRRMLEMVLARAAEGPAMLTFEEAEGVLRAVAATRIALAVRNGMFELDELPEVPETPQQMLVAFLGMLQEDLVIAMDRAPRTD